MVEDAFRYPPEGDEATETLLVGCAIGAVSGIPSTIVAVVATFPTAERE